ncbi:MAG: hypothetical protein UY96_C0003G0095 [Parcubacteria group bacterium GW2011_GWB1_56_8]|nr:MAG: hypothetical protein UY96_C0003G0095 [Parcubacteria group bacterium GW2011_GWB1_56_8]
MSDKKMIGVYLSEQEHAFVETAIRSTRVSFSAQCRALLLTWANVALCRPGSYDGPCGSVTGCQNQNAKWYHVEGQSFFCEECATRINSIRPGTCVLNGGPQITKKDVDQMIARIAKEAAEVNQDKVIARLDKAQVTFLKELETLKQMCAPLLSLKPVSSLFDQMKTQ